MTRRGQRWADLPVRVKVLTLLSLPLGGLLACVISGILLVGQTNDLLASTHQTTVAINDLNAKLQLLTDAETGIRGFAATGDEVFLQPYNQALAAAPKALANGVPGANGVLTPQQTDALKANVVNELVTLNQIRLGVSNGTLSGTALTAKLLTGKKYMDAVRADISVVESRLDSLRTTQRDQLQSYVNWSQVVDYLGLGVVVVTILVFLVLLRRVGGRLALIARNAVHLGAEEPLELSRESQDELGRLGHALMVASARLDQRRLELEEARDEALAATLAKDEFLSRMSHELRTPLTAILGFGQLLQLEDLSPDNADSIDHIVTAGQHLLQLINEVLDISQIESGHLSLSMEPILLREVVTEIVSLMSPIAAAHAVNVEARGLEGLAVWADRQRIKQVLLNLVSNAIKYNRQGGSIVITGSVSADTVALTVADTGVGIPESSLDRLFVPFDRMEATNSGIEGTGVGLSLSKALVEAMAGTIGADSEVGQGSRFWVELPVAEFDSRRSSGPRAQKGGGIVLYVEDNLASLRMIERLFNGRPETLQVSVQGTIALELARELHPVLILLDLHLPDMSGEEALRRLKADPETASIPVVVLSADVTPGRIDRILDAGAVGYLSKPVDVPRLIAYLDNAGRNPELVAPVAPTDGADTTEPLP
ncbi:MAG TPA: ATP-binding protein [Acidimicrobiales bacterium]|nr:ATP-binding protein [Acidimicrobiales bacterium]